jgi:hypothetical protein
VNTRADRGTGFPKTIVILPRHKSILLKLVTKENTLRASRGEPPVSIASYMHMIVDKIAAQEGIAT